MTIGLFIAGVLVFVVLALVIGYYSNKKRVSEFTTWATQHGWTYAKNDSRYADMPWGYPFGEGHSRLAMDVLTANKADTPALCFTLRYKTTTTTTNANGGTTTSEETHYYSVYSVPIAKALPTLRVSKEGVFGKLARMVGMHDIEFESEDFNREFKVKGDDRKFASDVINPQMMQFLLDGSAPGFTIVGSDLILVRRGRLKLETVEPSVAYLHAVISHIPNFIWTG